MKTKILLFIALSLVLGCCSDDDSKPASEIDKLPPATQTGANTFGCLLDGKVFLPDNLPNTIICFYQLVDEEYYFTVSASNYRYDILTVLSLKTEKKQISQGETYNLYEQYIEGNAFGTFYTTGNSDISSTTHTHTGKMTITKLDEINHIVSGTFWFDVQDTEGVVHQIREGRFDFQYTN